MSERRAPALLRVLGGQYGVFLAGNGLSLIGTWMQRIACSWLVWEWTGSAFWLGILAAGDLLPVMIVGPFAGVAADRWDRLRQNRVAQVVSAILALALALLLATDRLTLGLLVALVTLQGTLVAIVQPARLAMVNQMVGPKDLGTAVALNSVNVNLARLLGPAVAGLMILRLDVLWVFLLNAALTLLFVVVLGRLQLAPQEISRRHAGFMAEMREGFAHVLQTAPVRQILGIMLLGGVLVRSMLEILPAVAAGSFDHAATGLAVLTGAAGLGAVVAGLTTRQDQTARMLVVVLAWWGLGALSTLALVWAGTPALSALAALVMGGAMSRGLIGTQTFVQLSTPDFLRGRVLSVHGLIARGSPALGALGIGFAADRVGLAATVTVTSATLALLLLALLPRVQATAARLADAD